MIMTLSGRDAYALVWSRAGFCSLIFPCSVVDANSSHFFGDFSACCKLVIECCSESVLISLTSSVTHFLVAFIGKGDMAH